MTSGPRKNDLLFHTYGLYESLANEVQALVQEVEGLEANRFLNTAPADLAAYLVAKRRAEPIIIYRDKMYASESEAQVHVYREPVRWIDGNGRPIVVPGQRIEIRVPFAGDPMLLQARANTYTSNPPRAEIQGQEIVLVFEMAADSPRDIRAELDSTLASIEQHLGWQAAMLHEHNRSLPAVAESAITRRRERLLANSNRLAALGIPVKARADAPMTYAVPTVQKRAAPILPPASSAAFEPEPAWALEQYEHALSIIQQMALVMERSPSAFAKMDEEALRQHFLVQLNGHFEGKATAETFNQEGKTDILLREGARNVFIAECKFWKGPNHFHKAIDQLLGYAAWRDTKTAILVFNRGVSLTKVLEGVSQTAEAHSNFKRKETWPHETGFRYTFHHNGDLNREFTLTILVFNVPA